MLVHIFTENTFFERNKPIKIAYDVVILSTKSNIGYFVLVLVYNAVVFISYLFQKLFNFGYHVVNRTLKKQVLLRIFSYYFDAFSLDQALQDACSKFTEDFCDGVWRV